MKINKKFIIEILEIFLFPLIILIVHGFLSYFNVYETIWWIDIPMHFIGGLLIGRSYFLLLKIFQHEGFLGNMHSLLFFIFVISLVALTTVTWEFVEFTLDYIDNAMRQPSLANTMQDLFLGLFGGIFGYSIQFYIQNNKNK